jgi:hypothetical protein
MFKRILIVSCFLFSSCGEGAEKSSVKSESYNTSSDVAAMSSVLNEGDQVALARKADAAIENMVKRAVRELRRNDFNDSAEAFKAEYVTMYSGRLTAMTTARVDGRLGDIGDYAPMSEFLVRLHTKLLSVLGQDVMDFTHLEDIRTFNYTIPVVFHFNTIPDGAIDVTEYGVHFVPFSGCVAYWGTWGVCTAATWGMGAVTFVCTPAAMIVKRVTVKRIAPPMSPKFYGWFYN